MEMGSWPRPSHNIPKPAMNHFIPKLLLGLLL